ncbi:MAG: S-layer homology domain-containing protein [Acidaminococcus fermentans]|nr:S-layer homology domain-containing protein [Acidaminococcus fermentans]MDY2853236.1 S-layer homology domain-containing protein [Acidaminococcus fermentans]
MKKSLVFAMAMALGVSATAFATNPFSDLPAGHWAYGAVAKLAAAGVVDGYPDGTFKGDRTMTRYEMAQIVAKALAKGAIGADDKLVSEFADELDNLGVRISKLEKNADNVQITGEAQMSYRNDSGSATGKGSESDLRTRLWFTGEVNDNWHYVAMLENHQYFGGQNESGDSDTDFQRAFLDGRIGSVELKAGRYDEFLADGNIYDSQVDGVKAKVNLGHASYLQAAYGKMADVSGFGYMSDDEKTSVADKFWTAELGGDTGNLHLSATYTRADNVTFLDGADNEIWTAGAGYQAGKLGLNAMYLRGSNDYEKDRSWDKDGWVAGLTYGGAESDKPGSWGLLATYYDQSASTVIAHTMDGNWDTFVPGESGVTNGFKGWKVGGNLTLAKNMVAEVDYYDLKGKEGDQNGKHARTLWSQFVVTF